MAVRNIISIGLFMTALPAGAQEVAPPSPPAIVFQPGTGGTAGQMPYALPAARPMMDCASLESVSGTISKDYYGPAAALPPRRPRPTRNRIRIRPLRPTDPALRVPNSSTIHSPAAARPAKGTSRNGIRAIAITATMDGARATSADAAGSANRTDHAEAAVVKVRRSRAVISPN